MLLRKLEYRRPEPRANWWRLMCVVAGLLVGSICLALISWAALVYWTAWLSNSPAYFQWAGGLDNLVAIIIVLSLAGWGFAWLGRWDRQPRVAAFGIAINVFILLASILALFIIIVAPSIGVIW